MKCHSSPLSCINICRREQVFCKWQIRKPFAPALRERCSARGHDSIEMRRSATQDGGNMSFSDTNIIPPPLTFWGKIWNNIYRIVLNLNITFNSIVPLHSGAFASLSSIKGHCRTKLTTATTFSRNTLQTLEETLETNLTARVPELETVTSSLNTHLYSSPSHSSPHVNVCFFTYFLHVKNDFHINTEAVHTYIQMCIMFLRCGTWITSDVKLNMAAQRDASEVFKLFRTVP